MTRLAFACALGKGVDVDALLRKAGLSRIQIEDPQVRISVRSQVVFLELVAKALDDDLLGFHLSQNFDLRMIGLLYYVLASSETLGEALGRVARYSSIVNEGFRVTVREGREI
ncbi:MAG: AraC family transcriptional regulator ligand-binding domain-containing protein, partial [Xanthobacteraceae bacterium]